VLDIDPNAIRHIPCGRRRSSAPSLGRKMEARDSVPSIRSKVMRFSTWNELYPHHSENAGQQLPQLGSGWNRCAEGLSSGAAKLSTV